MTNPPGPDAVDTQASAAASSLEQRVRQLSEALKHVQDAVVVCDQAGRITEWNPAAEDMFGWSRLEMLGAPVEQLVPPEEKASFSEAWERLRAGDDVPAYEAMRLARDGTPHAVSVHATGFHEHGAFAGGVATFREPSPQQRQEHLLSELLAKMPVVVAAYDAEAKVTLAAGGGYERPGVGRILAPGTALLDALLPGSALHDAVTASLEGQPTSHVQMLIDDRSWQCFVSPLSSGEGRAAGFLSAVDVTSERVLDDRLQVLLSSAPLCLVTFDAAGRITYAAGSAFTSMGVEPRDLLGLRVLDLYGETPEVEQAVAACLAGGRVDVVSEHEGHVWDLHYRSYRGPHGEVTGGVVIAQDATDWVGAGAASDGSAGPEPLRGLLERDDVTGLPGKRGLQRRLDEPVPHGTHRAVAVVDLDAFSLVGEAYGRESGDVVLREVADRLMSVRGSALVGRWEADVFVLVLDAEDARDQMGAVVEAIGAAVVEPVRLPDGPLHLTASIGIAVSDTAPSADLLRSAELALQQAQQGGRARAAWFTADLRPALGQVRLAGDLRRALTSDELRLHYQPVVDLESRRTVGMEALLRWEHPSEGLLAPVSFVGLAERTGLVHGLGQWVAREATKAAAELSAAGLSYSMAINVSARQLVEAGLVGMLQEVLEESGCEPSSLVVEVTEGAVMTDLNAAVGTLRALKDLGVRLALDDFGTGYTSLLYLKHFPVDTIKIDRSFVAGLGIDEDDSAIVASTVSLAHRVGVTCVAEGVETVDQLELLRAVGCDQAQGYLFSRPLPFQQLRTWLSEHGPDVRRAAESPPPPPPELDEILRMHTAGASLNTIAAALNVLGKRTDRGTRWRAQSVAAVIARCAYPGLSLSEGRRPATY